MGSSIAGSSRKYGIFNSNPVVPILSVCLLPPRDKTMDSSNIDLPGSEIESIDLDDGVLRVRFSRAYIIKTMTGSVERTKWWQMGDLVMEGVEVAGELPRGTLLVCAGGDVGENVYTYRDMIPLPLDSRGRAHCALSFEGTDQKLTAIAETVRLEMRGTPKYIEHIRPE